MAELGALNYHPGNALLHRFDVRLKLVALIMISLASVSASALGLVLATMLLLAAAVNTRLPLMRLLSELRYFVVFLIFVCLARALTVPGETVWRLGFIVVSREGLILGALIGWRLALVVLLGALLVATSRSADIRAAVEWFLKPLPGVPHKRIGTMIGLMVRFIPVVFNQVQEILEAQRARGVENRKSPLYRLPRLLNPILRKTFARADELAIAMEARCYTENRTGPHFVTGATDWLTIGGVTLICVAMYVA